MSEKLKMKGKPVEQDEIDYGSYEGQGMESVAVDDIKIPILAMLQSGSPQVKKSDPAYIKGAEEGDIFNTVTNEIWKGTTGVKVIPCSFKKVAMEWALREKGGGLKGIHEADTVLWNEVRVNEKGQSILPNGNSLVLTANYYVLFQSANESWSPAMLSFSSTRLKQSRQWLGRIAGYKMEKNGKTFTPPMFAHIFTIAAMPEKNDKGSWMTWNIQPEGIVSKTDLFLTAQQFSDQVQKAPKLAPAAQANALAYAGASNADDDVPM